LAEGGGVSSDSPLATEAGIEQPKMQLDVKVESRGACERHVTVTIPRDEIERYYRKHFDDLAPKAEIPGFRSGRAPRQLVESKFRKEVGEQVKGSLLMDSLSQVSQGSDFAAISEPDLDFDSITLPDEGSLTYEFNIEVRPEFELPNWKGLKLERETHEFSEEEVDHAVSEFFERFSPLAPVDDRAKLNDYLVVRIGTSLDGEVVSSTGEETVQLRNKLVCGDATIEGFGRLMTGVRVGDKKSTRVKLSEFADNDALQGKEVDVEFEVLEVKRIDDSDRAKVVERLGLGSDAAVRDLVVKGLESRLEYHRRQRIRQQISKTLTEAANWALPQALLKRQSRRELERAVIEMRTSGFSEDEIQTQENKLRQNILARTENLLKEHFILERIAEHEKIEDQPEDYDREIARIALQKNDSPRRVRARLERSGSMDALRNMIIEQKVIALIEQHAKFKDVPYDSRDTSSFFGADFSLGGEPKADIPDAKYDPTTVDAFQQKYGERKERS
jgi:trigger factor